MEKSIEAESRELGSLLEENRELVSLCAEVRGLGSPLQYS